MADGEKMGKTAAGAVWLNEEALSSYDYWQYWRNVDDRDVGRFLRLFTELDLGEIARLEALEGEEINQAKKILADEATRLCRGGAAAKTAAETARQTFEEGGLDDNLPSITLRRDDLAAGKSLVDLYVEAGLASSKKEARRLIEQGGARVDGALVEAVDQVIVADNFGVDDRLKLSAGRKRHALVKLARS